MMVLPYATHTHTQTTPSSSRVQIVTDLVSRLHLRLHTVRSYSEMKQVFAALTGDRQGSWRASERSPVKVCVLGGDTLISMVLRAYVDSSRPTDPHLPMGLFRFYVVPISKIASQQTSASSTRVSRPVTRPSPQAVSGQNVTGPQNTEFTVESNGSECVVLCAFSMFAL